jgi:hypothetical protein
MSDKQSYWFPAKRYSWGWGVPTAWQGWVVMLVFCALVLVGTVALLPSHGAGVFIAYTVLLCAGLVAVCWATGEPPAWRWGGK